MIRKPYLITQAIKTYLLASILTTAIGQLNGIVDSVMMGQILGPDALSAITLALPMLSIVTVVYILLAGGAALLAGKAIGARDYNLSSKIFSVSMISLTVIGIAASVLTWLFRDPLTSMVCTNERLYPFAVQYLGWAMGLSYFTMLSQALSQFTDVDGKPRLVTYAMGISFVLNIVFDLLLVLAFGMGIAGSAIASAISVVGSSLFLIRYSVRRTASYRLRLKLPDFFSILAGNVKNGVAMMIGVLMTAACFMFLNNIVLERLGPDGMFVMSVAGGLMGISSLLATGASQAFTAVGGMLFGQEDYRGMRLLFNRCAVIILGTAVLFTLIGQLFPEFYVVLYGAKTPALIASASHSLRIITLMFIPFLLLTMMPSVYQILGHLKLVGLVGLAFFVILLPSVWLFSRTDEPANLWIAFPLAAWGGMLLCLPVLGLVHRRMPDTAPLTLIPNVNPYHRMLDISVPAKQASIQEAMSEVRQFVNDLALETGRLRNAVEICTEETLQNIVNYSGISDSHYIDLRITATDEKVLLVIKDDGVAFDPVSVATEKQKLGLTLTKALCGDMDYKYMYGQNMTFMGWMRDDTKNTYTKSTTLDLDKLLSDEPAKESIRDTEKKDEPLLSLRGIHKTYPGATPLHVLKGVDLDIHEGELVSIMGASGSGKSTLLNVIGILDDYDEGEYRLGGHLIKNLSEDEEADFRNELIGFIFQTFNLVNYKNALDNVALPLMYRGVDRETRNKLAMEYLEKVGLAAHWDHTPMQMSGGQRQRVAIARALIQHPKIILADEPTGALDSKTTQEVMDMLREVNRKEGQTVIIVTHEQEIADQTDRRIFFKDGLIFRDERAKIEE